MSPLRIVYLLLAILGLVMTWRYNLQFMSEAGGSFSITDFVAAANANPAASSLSWDLAVACIAGLTWMFFESRRLGMRFYWLYLIFSFGIAFAFTFPLFLFFRQGKLEAGETQHQG